jgi:PAS domain S-box-containing protein
VHGDAGAGVTVNMAFTPAQLSRVAVWLSLAAAALGVLGLLGNVLDSEWLAATIPGRPRMQPGTSLGVVLASVGIMLQLGQPGRTRFAFSRLIGAAVASYGTAVVLEYGYQLNLGIDWRLSGASSLGPYPGRPSPLTAAALAALGGSVLLRDLRGRFTAAREALCLLALCISFASLIGHTFGAGALYEFRGSHVIGVALSTGLALFSLAVATWFANPQTRLLRIAIAPGPGGVMFRRLGTTAVLGAPLLGGLLLLFAKASGLRDLALILAVGSVLAVVFAVALLTSSALSIERSAVAAEQNRMRAEELFEQAAEGIFIADLSGRYTEVNEAGCRLLGLARDEILGKSIIDLIPESDIERLWRERDALLQGVVHIAQWRLRRKDGTYAQTEVTAKILPDGRWQGFVRDITERLELERKLLESREFMARVLESSTEYGIIAEDLDGRVVLWNEGARRNYGYEASEICGQPSAVLVAPAQLEVWAALHARAVEQGNAEGNLLARRKDGSTFAASIVCTRRLDADKAKAGVLLVTRDLTVEQRYLAEQEFLSRVGVELASCLEERETLACVTQLASSFLGDLVVIDLVQGRSAGRALALERAGEHALARAVAELGPIRTAGHPLETVLESKQPLLLAEITAEDRARFATSPEHAQVLEKVHANSAMLVPLIARGQLLAVLSIVARDGSRRYGPDDLRLAMELARRAALTLDNVQLFQQSRLDQRQTAQALDEKEVLLKEIHHRVKNNLQVISSLFSLQRQRTQNLELRSLLDESRTRIESIALVHEQLYRSADLAAIDFDEYLRNLVDAIRSSYGAGAITTEVSARNVLLEIEQAVPCALLVCELVSNSFKHAFGKGSGKVWVRAERDAEGFCVLEVGDDGHGLPADLDWTKTHSLGLRLVYGLIRQLRATTTVHSSNGTSFRLRFPFWHAKPNMAPEAARQAAC